MCDFKTVTVYAEIISRAVESENEILLKETTNNLKQYLQYNTDKTKMEIEKQKIIKYISDKIENSMTNWGVFQGREDKPEKIFYDNLAIEIYTYVRQGVKTKKMASGKCEHEFEVLEEDGFYPEFEKVQCTRCMKINMRKICSTKK